MTRHRILNPKTGRMVYKTGALGKNIQKKYRSKPMVSKQNAKKKKHVNEKQVKKKNTSKKEKKKKGLVPGKWYGYPGATKSVAPFKIAGKTKGFARRPSARTEFNRNNMEDQFYAGKWHYMALDCTGRPTYKLYT